MRVRVGEEQYALGVEHVYEVVDLGELTPVPGAADSVLGLRNVDGEIVPAFDLATILQIRSERKPQRLLVTECRSQRAAFAVDEVIDVGPIAGTMQESESRYLLASTVLDGAMVGVLAVDALFDSIMAEV
ncbi:MAG TPA: chemotaxis protein CheW [Solirubrobacteraceae bacterium]|nr:chemotaxis protein CheW [Solirubrobacteraceae bacterium]